MATEERVAVVAGVRELRERARGPAAAIDGLSPSELSSRRWGGDPEASPRRRSGWPIDPRGSTSPNI
jgi:hypothetical protein